MWGQPPSAVRRAKPGKDDRGSAQIMPAKVTGLIPMGKIPTATVC